MPEVCLGRSVGWPARLSRARAGYGDELVQKLSARLTSRFGRGFSPRTVRRIRQFYLTYPEGSNLPLEPGEREIRTTLLANSGAEGIRPTLLARSGGASTALFPATLGWSHYANLLKVEADGARAFYEIEAATEGWTVRELNRQIGSLLYERLAKSRDKDGVMALAREGQQVTTPRSVLKDPLVLEFLDLAERPQWRERDLEQAIIDQLETFLLELGKGFCFVARQKRITLDGDHFFVDLVFYNRLLRCFVLVDLKLGKLTHQDLGQMQMYVNLYDETERAADEESTVGIVLCSGLSTDGLADPRHGKLRLAFELPGDCFGGFEILFPAALTSVPSVTSAAELHVFATGLLLSVASSHAVIAVAAH